MATSADKRKQSSSTRFQAREDVGLEDWDAPDAEHLVLHARHPIHPDWAITATFEVEGTSPLLTGIFVRPATGWAPPGGLTSDVVRSIKLDELRRRATARLQSPEVAGYLGIDPSRVKQPKGPGRPGRTDLDYALLARRYVGLLDQRSPVKLLSKQEKLSEATVRVLIYEARRRGLLTPSEPGRAGGKLTQKAMWLLAAEGDSEDEDGED